MSDTVGDIQNYLADFNPKDPVISKAEPVLAGGEAGDDSELLSSAVGGGAGQYFVDQETGQYYFQSSTGDTLHVVDKADVPGAMLDTEDQDTDLAQVMGDHIGKEETELPPNQVI